MRTQSQARKEALAKAETIVSNTMDEQDAGVAKALKAYSEPKINDVQSSIVRPTLSKLNQAPFR